MNPLRHKLHALIDELVDLVEAAKPADDWVDQKTSPLGRERHCTLVRTGALKGVKDGRRIMVRRVDVEAYIAKHQVIKVDEKADEDREAARILAMMNRKSA